MIELLCRVLVDLVFSAALAWWFYRDGYRAGLAASEDNADRKGA